MKARLALVMLLLANPAIAQRVILPLNGTWQIGESIAPEPATFWLGQSVTAWKGDSVAARAAAMPLTLALASPGSITPLAAPSRWRTAPRIRACWAWGVPSSTAPATTSACSPQRSASA